MSGSRAVIVENHLPDEWAVESLRDEATRALTRIPKLLPPRWLYDDRGSELFDMITRLAEYYPTEAERSILRAHAATIVGVSGADTVVELGSGTSDKTRTLLDAFWSAGLLRRFVPLDVSESTLLTAAHDLVTRYPGLEVRAIVGDFTRHLQLLPRGGRRLVAFLGSTIGNLYVEERRAFLGALADQLDQGEWLLLGIDLLKPLERIVDAYNDRAGVTDAFVHNVLDVLNRELGADFDVPAFDYVPFWDVKEERLDLRLRPADPQSVHLSELGLVIDIAAGEELHVEISAKFRPERFREELDELGFATEYLWTDERADFALLLARRR